MAYNEKVPLPKDGQPVAAGSLVPSLRAIDENVRYLKDLFETAALGQTVFARNVTVEAGALVGQPVYYNTANQQFERAIANTNVDPLTGAMTTTDSTQVWGVVASKTNATLADLLLQGYYAMDIDNAVDGVIVAGVYYLSSVTPGKLVKNRPPLSVKVLMTDGEGMVYVHPEFKDSFDDHKHYKFSLVCAPAGDYTPDTVAVVDNPDTDIEGWLPADDAIFEGKAPANAAFGYNLSVSALRHVFPPIPLQSVYLEWDKITGDDTPGGVGVPLGSDGLAVINTDGIWWLSNCQTDAPWVSSDAYTNGVWSEYTEDDPEVIECPRNRYMSLTLWYTRMNFKTSGTVVTSVRAKEGSHLLVTCYPTGGDATTGDLELDLDLEFVVGDDDTVGHLVFKTLTDGEFGRGVVVEGIKPGGSNVTMTSATKRRETPGDAGTDWVYQGIVTVSASLDVNGREIPLDLTRLNGVTEEFYAEVPALGFAAGVESELRGRLRVPATDIPEGTTCSLRFWLLGRGAGPTALPALTMYYRVISVPSGATALPTADTGPIVISDATDVSLDEYIELEGGEIAVAAGDIILFSLIRADDDGYAGQIQILDLRGVLYT